MRSLALLLRGLFCSSSSCRCDDLVVHEAERTADASEEVFLYLPLGIACLHHILHNAVFQEW